jgi:hypothetical protein
VQPQAKPQAKPKINKKQANPEEISTDQVD